MVRLAIIGDVHRRWDEADARWFDGSDYDMVLFVGDLGSYGHRRTLEVARSIARLRKPTLVLPGNHDTVNLVQMVAEVLEGETGVSFEWLRHVAGVGHGRRWRQLRRALAPVPLVGFGRRRLPDGLAPDLEIIAARPLSMGGDGCAFSPLLRRRYGIGTIQDSADFLCRMVDASPARRLVFLAHNGPTGLGDRRDDIWGCDFRRSEGDFGDPDLRIAVDHAIASGKRVLAVVAGHMHHRLKRGGGQRRWILRRDGVLYVNAARVPRILEEGGRTVRHHVALEIDGDRAEAEEVLVDRSA
ncbi:MAG: metallophosphoesterase [Myxococcota bacterium]